MAMNGMTPLTQDPEQSLMGILQQLQGSQPPSPATQAQTQTSQAGALMSAFSSGFLGRPDPVEQRAQAAFAAHQRSLQAQAGVASELSEIQRSRETRAEAMKRTELVTAEKMKKSIDPVERLFALRIEQKHGLIPQDANIEKIAKMNHPEYHKLWDQAISIVQQGGNPMDSTRFGQIFDPEVFPVQQFQQLMAQGGSVALESQKFNPQAPTHGMLESEYAHLRTLPKGSLSEFQERRLEALKPLVDKTDQQKALVERTAAKFLAQQTLIKGPPTSELDMVEREIDALKKATSLVDRGQSTIEFFQREAERQGLTGSAAFGFVENKLMSLEQIRATGRAQGAFAGPATPDDLKNMRNADTGAAPPPFNPETGKAWSKQELVLKNYRDIDKNDLTLLADIGKTQVLVQGLFGMTDRLITATSPGEAALQWGQLHLGALSRTNPLAATYQDERGAFLGNLARSVSAERGVLTTPDIIRIDKAFPNFADTVAVKEQKKTVLNQIIRYNLKVTQDKVFGRPVDEGAARAAVEEMLNKLDVLNAPSQATIKLGVADLEQRKKAGESLRKKYGVGE